MATRIFLSGRFDNDAAVEKAWLKRTGCKYRCFTYASIDEMNKNYNSRVVTSLKLCEDRGVGIMLDSGAFSLHSIVAASTKRTTKANKTHTVDVEEVAEAYFDRYTKFCTEHQHKWTFFVTLDFKKHCPTIYSMQQRFAKLGLHPIPVYHGDESLDWLDRYADLGSKLIGLGTSRAARGHNKKDKRYYLDNVFDRCAKLGLDLHGLAMTSFSLMVSYPWWSVDSANWTKSATYGDITVLDRDKNVVHNIHISKRYKDVAHCYNKMSRRHRAQIKEMVENMGFDIEALRDKGMDGTRARHDFNGYVFSQLSDINDHTVRSSKWDRLL